MFTTSAGKNLLTLIESTPDQERIAHDHFIDLLDKASDKQEAWGEFLQEFVRHFNLNACHLMVINDQTNATLVHLSAGTPVETQYIESYLNHYISLDMILTEARISETGESFVTNHWKDKERYYKSSYYREWAMPQGLAEGGAACVFIEGDWRCIMVHNRTSAQGPYSFGEEYRMKSMLPYIKRAVKTCYIQTQQRQCNTRANAIVEGYRTPVAILNEFGEIWASNQLMNQMIEDQNPLYIRDGILRIDNQKKDRLMTTSIFNAFKQMAGVKLDLPSMVDVDQDIRLHFKGISERSGDLNISKGVMVYAVSNQYRKHVSIETLMEMFPLTPAESRVCIHILQGKELKEIATQEKKSVNTVREQLYQSFRKTGCNSQSALVNMLTTIPVLSN